MRPIETCPYWKRVLLLLPEFDSFASTWWIGMREGGDPRNHGYDERWKIAVPHSLPPSTPNGLRKQVWVGELPAPIGWEELPRENKDNPND